MPVWYLNSQQDEQQRAHKHHQAKQEQERGQKGVICPKPLLSKSLLLQEKESKTKTAPDFFFFLPFQDV